MPAFQHHERWDGGGYLLDINGGAISGYAQIISIADAYFMSGLKVHFGLQARFKGSGFL